MKLILIYGPPAAGKLTVAAELSKLTGIKLADNHKMLDYLAELFPREDHNYFEIRTALGRTIRLAIFEAAAKAGLDLITTIAPISPGAHDFLFDIKKKVELAGGQVCFVQLLPSHEAMRSRVVDPSRRGKKADTVKRWDDIIAESPWALDPLPDTDSLLIDNSDILPVEVARRHRGVTQGLANLGLIVAVDAYPDYCR